jgi:hypothetical protein
VSECLSARVREGVTCVSVKCEALVEEIFTKNC